MFKFSVPDVGRVIMIGEPCSMQVLPSALIGPAKCTLTGDGVAPAVVGSVTTMFSPVARGERLVSAITPGEISEVKITRETGFESAGTAPGFSTCTEMTPAVAISAGKSVIVQRPEVGQFVVRGEPFTRICDDPLDVVGTKLSPCTANKKLFGAPAMTLEGRIVSMTGPDSSATVAVAEVDGLATLVATIEIAFGEGATPGAI